jgi:hypothetical protein
VYEITIGDEFARWFEALDANAAEQVAGALEVVAATGPAFDPVKQSQSLLWFDDTGNEMGSAPLASELAELESYRLSPDYGDLLSWHREVVRFLDGPRFKEALDQLDGATAAEAVQGVRRVRENLRAAWMSFVSEAPRLAGGALRSSRAAAAERRSPRAARSVKSALDHVLALVGLGLGALGDRESGLRELTVASATPALRVLYGLDVPGQRLVALIGDALTRAYYGDSVRRAEQRWSEYLARGQVEERLHPL